jgi:hypothetical protein
MLPVRAPMVLYVFGCRVFAVVVAVAVAVVGTIVNYHRI